MCANNVQDIKTGSLVATDDVVSVVSSRWNECDRYGSLGHVFFTLLRLEQYRELWHYDMDGNRVSTSVPRRIPIMEGTRTAVTRPLRTSYFSEVHLLHTNSILDLFEVIDDVASDPSERHVPPLLAMEETLHRTIWSGSARRTMRLDAGQRAAGGMWVVAVGNWERFFLNLPNDPFAKNWYHDSEGHNLCTMLKKSNPFLDGFRKWVLHAPKEGAIPVKHVLSVRRLRP